MPRLINTLPTTKSITRNGKYSRNPISNARRISPIMNAGTRARQAAWSGAATAGMLARSRKSCRSAPRTLAAMNLWNGSAVSRRPSISPIKPWLIGCTPLVQAWSMAGCMTKNVRNSARPISTVFGGVPCAPIALRSSDSTMMMRVNAVPMTSRLGARDSSVTSAVNCTSRPVAPACPAAPRSMLTDCARASPAAAGPPRTAGRRPAAGCAGPSCSAPGRQPASPTRQPANPRRQPSDNDVRTTPGQHQQVPPVARNKLQAPGAIERQGLPQLQAPCARLPRQACRTHDAGEQPDQAKHQAECADGG